VASLDQSMQNVCCLVTICRYVWHAIRNEGSCHGLFEIKD
jgi:hypothetical protein